MQYKKVSHILRGIVSDLKIFKIFLAIVVIKQCVRHCLSVPQRLALGQNEYGFSPERTWKVLNIQI